MTNKHQVFPIYDWTNNDVWLYLLREKVDMGEGKSVEEIGKQLGMRPEEIFRLSDFSKEDFLNMMIKPNQGYSKAEFITKI